MAVIRTRRRPRTTKIMTHKWLVKFSNQKLPVLYMAMGRNCPVIQEIREQPCDLERRVSVRHPVHLRLRSFLVLSSLLMDTHTSFIAFSALWSSCCGHNMLGFISSASLFMIHVHQETIGLRSLTGRRVYSFHYWFEYFMCTVCVFMCSCISDLVWT